MASDSATTTSSDSSVFEMAHGIQLPMKSEATNLLDTPRSRKTYRLGIAAKKPSEKKASSPYSYYTKSRKHF